MSDSTEEHTSHIPNLFRHLSPVQLSLLSFLITSLLGGFLLWRTESMRVVPVDVPAHRQVQIYINDPTNQLVEHQRNEVHTYIEKHSQQGLSFIDALFTAVSALCVTGLTVSDFSLFTIPGQIITMFLIQMGGLGIIVFTSIFAMAVSRGISEHATFQKIIGNILDTDGNQVRRMIRYVTLYTFLFEGTATLIMGTYLQFNPQLPLHGINPWWWALFHSVSAFNNAGFGLLKTNLMEFVTDPVINLTIASLIILGGLGYPVLIGFHTYMRSKMITSVDKNQHRLIENMKPVAASSVQIRVAIVGTLLLLTLGTLIPFIDPSSMSLLEGYSLSQKLLIAFFQSVSTRTAGFNTIDVGGLGVATILFYIALMYVGANPAGTGGGIKIPTVAVLYGYIKDWFYEPGLPVKLLNRNVSKFAVSHAIRLFFISMAFIMLVTFLICLKESQWLITPDPIFNFIKVVFETVSAFGTVGLTMGYAGGAASFAALLTPFSKALLITTMLVGRLGPLTILASLPWKKELEEHELSADFPDAEKIQIG
jgi:trk system potassium uptake protein TrkH